MDYEQLSFVLAGDLRKKITMELNEPKTPTQLKEKIKTQDSSIARTLRELRKEKIVICLFPKKKKGRLYELTPSGQKIREKLENYQ